MDQLRARRHRHRTAGALAAALALPLAAGACAVIDDDDLFGGLGGRDRRTAEYRCDSDRRFEVTFRDDGREADVRTGEKRYQLELEDRDRGVRRYGKEDDDAQLFVDGDDARLRTEDEGNFSDCEAR